MMRESALPEPSPRPTFLPGAGGADAATQRALQQVSLRLRREVAWLWRERLPAPVADGMSGPLPPFKDPALHVLDQWRFAADKARFFAEDLTARHLGEQLAQATAQAPAKGATARRGSLAWVVRTLSLSPAEAFVLALALLPAVDGSAGPVFACCLNDPARQEPTLALAQRLWDEPDEILALADPAHALFTHGLLGEATGWNAPLRVPALVARELLTSAAQPGGKTKGEPAASRRRIVPVLGAPGADLQAVATAAATADGHALIAPPLLADTEHLRALMTQAWLRGSALYLPFDALAACAGDAAHRHDAPMALPLPQLPVTLYVGLPDRGALAHLGPQALPALQAPPATHAQRLAAWRAALPALADTPELADLAHRLRCEPPQIARIGAELSRSGRQPRADELLAAARADLDLGALAQPVQPRFQLKELMLPAAQTRQVDELVRAMQNLARTHHDWGTARAWNEGGLSALFAGPPGTGKTMAAEAIAQALALPMVRIDLSQVVNKYIGETEKNLKRLFDQADAAEVVLFFDEADALFGKRTEVKDAHDRYANLEVSYLLERMERFKGLAILATNRRKDLDEAFLRRLRFVIEFPLPGPAERLRIWRSLMPPGVDASELDLDFLAQRFPLAGGHLRAIVFHACLQTATPGAARRLTMPAIVQAIRREYDKLERACSLDQFGPYASLVADEAMTGPARSTGNGTKRRQER